MAATPRAIIKWRRDNYFNDTDYINYRLQDDIEDDFYNAEKASEVALFKLDYLNPSYAKERFKGTKLPIFEGGKNNASSKR